ncbi:DUF3011 domain-containing protein [Roseateles sp. DAIF2]|nr:DUF3011 domain-containing protein [Roseateles sp. DAIF2]
MAGTLSLALVATPALAEDQKVELRSSGDYVSQRLPDGTREVELDRQLSGSCRFNRTWGYDLSNKELWVNGGCAGRFRLSGDFKDEERSGNSSNAGIAVAAVAAIAGLALLASHNRDKDKDRDRPDYNDGGNNNNGGSGYARQIRGAGNMCMDISGRVREGAPAILYNCNNGDNQRFDWGRGGELRVGGLCLDVAGGNRDNGAQVIAFRCNGDDNQRWQMRGNQIRSRMNGKCLDVRDGRIRAGQPLQLWDCHGGENQRWWW